MAKRKVSQTTGQLGQKNMYISPSFDTHKIVKSFTAAGMKEVQAEAVVSAIVESRDHDLSRLATKEQLDSIKEELKFFSTKEQLDSIKEEMKFFSTKEQLDSIKEEMKFFSTKEQLGAVKEQIEDLKEEMKLYVTKEQFETKLESSISRLEASLLKWFIATAMTMTGVISGIVIAAVKFIH